jgi:hypothetical protein
VATKPLTHDQQFLRITSQKLADIRKRSQAKYTKGGKRLVRPAIAVEFDLSEFRAWTVEQFGGDAWGSRRCHYGCGRWLTVETFVPDHFKALARGGHNSLDNFVVCCSVCNDIKGSLDGDWFNFLLACLAQMPESQASIIRERLAKSEKAASSVRMLRGQLHRFRTNPQQLQEQI